MMKRKQPEEDVFNLHFGAEESNQVNQEDEDPATQTAVTKEGLVTGRKTKETTLEVNANSLVPVEGTGHVADADEEDGTM